MTECDLIAFYANRLLEEELTADLPLNNLLSIALKAAGLPPNTTRMELLALDLPNPADAAGCLAEEARLTCSELLLPGASELAARLARTEQAHETAQMICGLIWRDAYDLAISRDRAQMANRADFDASEFIEDYENEQRIQERWRATNLEVKELVMAFLSLCTEAVLEAH